MVLENRAQLWIPGISPYPYQFQCVTGTTDII